MTSAASLGLNWLKVNSRLLHIATSKSSEADCLDYLFNSSQGFIKKAAFKSHNWTNRWKNHKNESVQRGKRLWKVNPPVAPVKLISEQISCLFMVTLIPDDVVVLRRLIVIKTWQRMLDPKHKSLFLYLNTEKMENNKIFFCKYAFNTSFSWNPRNVCWWG